MSEKYPFVFEKDFGSGTVRALSEQFRNASPFNHVVIDNFLPAEHAQFLSDRFPPPEHPVWLDWKKRSPYQYGKQGPGGSENFHLLDPEFKFALYEFNSSCFLSFLERLTGITKLVPDPYFLGGGMHQIVHGGILDIHTDFNDYKKLDLYRQLNLLIYLTEDWQPGYGGELELWNAGPSEGGVCAKSVPPVFNRAVIFKTDKTSFHGHPNEWSAPGSKTRRSLAFYYYTARKLEGFAYDQRTDFQGVKSKRLRRWF